MQKIYLISGIDTGIGKTVATGLMARFLTAHGTDAITVKMVQTGNDGFSEDIAVHRKICGGMEFPEDRSGLTAPQIFKYPSSPLLAASLEGKTVDVNVIAHAVEACAEKHEVVIVESAGGLHVPLTGDMLTIDFAAAHRWPLVLVTCGRLGAINHTLMSLETAKTRGIPVAGVIHNWFPDADPLVDADAFDAAQRYLAKWNMRSALVRIPQIQIDGPYPDIDFSEIFA